MVLLSIDFYKNIKLVNYCKNNHKTTQQTVSLILINFLKNNSDHFFYPFRESAVCCLLSANDGGEKTGCSFSFLKLFGLVVHIFN